MGGAAGPDFTQAADRGEEMTQTLEGTPATGRPLGRRVSARLGGRAIPATSAPVTMLARHRGKAATS